MLLIVVKCADGANLIPLVNCDRSSDSREESLRPLRISFSDQSPVFGIRSAQIGAYDAALVVSMRSEGEDLDRISPEFTADVDVCRLLRWKLEKRIKNNRV